MAFGLFINKKNYKCIYLINNNNYCFLDDNPIINFKNFTFGFKVTCTKKVIT